MAVLCVAWLAGCSGQQGEAAPQKAEEAPVSLGPETVTRVETRALQSGPVISGSLQARRSATLRAEAAGPVLEVKVEQGQAVKRGELLARLSDVALQDQLIAARSSVRLAENALLVATAEEERNAKLFNAEVITQRDFERAQLARHQSEAQLSEAQSRLALAREQVDRTRILAPFDGVVSERQANAGDVVQPGSPLVTVLDPRSLELAAAVPAEYSGKFRAGTPVDFRLSGDAEKSFTGKIERINPAVDPSTGQVRIYVTIPNVEHELLVGLFAQGRVVTASREAPALPLEAVDLRTTPPSVLRVRDGRLERVQVTLGLRDELAEWVELRSGPQVGDVVALGSVKDLPENTRVEVTQAPRQQGPGQPPSVPR